MAYITTQGEKLLEGEVVISAHGPSGILCYCCNQVGMHSMGAPGFAWSSCIDCVQHSYPGLVFSHRLRAAFIPRLARYTMAFLLLRQAGNHAKSVYSGAW